MDPLEPLIREVARNIGDGPSPERRALQRRAVIRGARAPRDQRGWWWLASLTVTAALLVLWIGGRAPRTAPMIASVGDRPFAAGAFLAAAEAPVVVSFSDRSRVTLGPGAAARLAQAEAQRVQLNLERGRLELVVTPDPARAWLVVAGPFTIDVTGTRFSVDWQPQTNTLAVEVAEGSVRVRGEAIEGDGNRLSAGQRLELRDPPAIAATPPVPEPLDVVEPVLEPSQQRPAPDVRWRALAEAGEHEEALAAAERAGLPALLARLDAEDLDRLAHSARLAGAAGPARAALEALRRRFPRDPRARTAGFLLGRVALELAGDAAAAAELFAAYLREQPDGALAEQARGRIMQMRRDAGDDAGSRAAATDYLAHHPQGSRATLARTILAAP
ncbi:MAG: FecR domain-containing protein [Nannocystis sp.]|nr:FecR family protein [Nannocystis sp.]MBA3548335.1 FecR domain-containing protein [Nannocystis sp.]